MSQKTRIQSIFQFVVIFSLVFLVTQMGLKMAFPDQYGDDKDIEAVILSPLDKTVKGQHSPALTIKNKTNEDLVLADRCPMPPVNVFLMQNGEKVALETEETVLPCKALTTVVAGESAHVDLSPWKYSLFDTYGEYRIELPASGSEEVIASSFSISEVGMITQLFRTFISKPLLNLLVLIASLSPDYNLGIAIILLTILVKLVLFLPTQHAMEGQRKMQVIQPEMDAVRKKYKQDPKKMQEETMKLWKKYKVNPMQSCLPMLIQFPILIGLFYVIRDGSVLAVSRHLLYTPYLDLPWTFGTNFLGLDLTQPNLYVLPPLLMVMQFFQMKLSFAIAKKKKDNKGEEKKKKGEPKSQQEIQQMVMLYGLPFMIGFFALQFPAAVSLYWGVSTLFAIAQQLFVNRKEL